MVYSCTDWNDVDEDLTAISVHGGYWQSSANKVGVMYRDMINISNMLDSVAFAQKINRTYSPFGDAYLSISVADLR